MRCTCPPDPRIACDRCDGRIEAYETYLYHGPDFDEQAADLESDRYERALWAAMGEAA